MLQALGSNASDKEIEQLFGEGKLVKNQLSFQDLADLMSSEKSPSLQKVISSENIEFIWHVMEQVDDARTSVGNFLLERGFYGSIKKTHDKKDVIVVHNRTNGQLEEEKIPEYIKVSLRVMYSNRGGRFAVEGHRIQKLLKHMSQQQGKKYDSPGSKKEIEHFIHYHGLNTDEMLDPIDSFKKF